MSLFEMTPGELTDLLLRHRYLYYVRHTPELSDTEYDAMERRGAERFPGHPVISAVGSSNIDDYPLYIREGRRPNAAERAERDERWKYDPYEL